MSSLSAGIAFCIKLATGLIVAVLFFVLGIETICKAPPIATMPLAHHASPVMLVGWLLSFGFITYGPRYKVLTVRAVGNACRSRCEVRGGNVPCVNRIGSFVQKQRGICHWWLVGKGRVAFFLLGVSVWSGVVRHMLYRMRESPPETVLWFCNSERFRFDFRITYLHRAVLGP